MEPTAAQERAGEIGTEFAENMSGKAQQAIDGFPHSSPEQRSAIASLVCEGLERYIAEQDALAA